MRMIFFSVLQGLDVARDFGDDDFGDVNAAVLVAGKAHVLVRDDQRIHRFHRGPGRSLGPGVLVVQVVVTLIRYCLKRPRPSQAATRWRSSSLPFLHILPLATPLRVQVHTTINLSIRFHGGWQREELMVDSPHTAACDAMLLGVATPAAESSVKVFALVSSLRQ